MAKRLVDDKYWWLTDGSILDVRSLDGQVKTRQSDLAAVPCAFSTRKDYCHFCMGVHVHKLHRINCPWCSRCLHHLCSSSAWPSISTKTSTNAMQWEIRTNLEHEELLLDLQLWVVHSARASRISAHFIVQQTIRWLSGSLSPIFIHDWWAIVTNHYV